MSFLLYINHLFIKALYFFDKLFILDSLDIMEIKEFVLKNKLAAKASYIISDIIYNRENLSN